MQLIHLLCLKFTNFRPKNVLEILGEFLKLKNKYITCIHCLCHGTQNWDRGIVSDVSTGWPHVVILVDWTWFWKVHFCVYKVPCTLTVHVGAQTNCHSDGAPALLCGDENVPKGQSGLYSRVARQKTLQIIKYIKAQLEFAKDS